MIGGTLLGVGMYISASCPGSLFVQLGAGVPNAPYVLLGALLGTILYSYLIEPFCSKLNHDFHSPAPHVSLDNFLPLSSIATNISLSAALLLAISLSETFLVSPTPFTLSKISLSDTVWSPYLSGALIGLLEIPSYLFIGVTLGSSTGPGWFLGKLAHRIGQGKFQAEHAPFLENVARNEVWYWQFHLLVGLVAGGFLSSYMSSSQLLASSLSTSPHILVVGSAMMFIGARIATGCTSGHGISGVSLLSVASFITSICMFGGGIGGGYVLG